MSISSSGRAVHVCREVCLHAIRGLGDLDEATGAYKPIDVVMKKRIRWMPWQSEAMKDVVACDKLRGAGNKALIRRCPNGETHSARSTPT